METWKVIDGFPDYEISDLGNVRKASTKEVKKATFNRKLNQYVVMLYRKTFPYSKAVHRLVAENFIPNPDGFKYVIHKEPQLRANNSVSNLQWSRSTNV